jgi:thiosulfate/3-mercaptopyruvate sulfurtransferase
MGPLLAAAELIERLDAVRLIDARGGGARAYAESHLEGAVFADLERDLASPRADPRRGGRHPLPDLEAWCRTLGNWGIAPGTPVVVYDAAGGANAAARAWWMLRAVGHRQVAVLDGGLQAGLAAGVPATAEAPVVAPVAYPVPDGRKWVLPSANADQVDEQRLDPDRCLLDVRAEFRYRGESDPFDPVPGHIPGAVNLPYSASLDAGGRFLPADQLRRRFEAALDGRGPGETTVYCGSGVTACHTLLAMAHAGLDGAALYVGSWSEWCRSDRPRASIVR